MESGITTGPVSPPRANVLAEVTYTHCEEDFVAWWMYSWEQAQNQRFYPLAHRLSSWARLTMLRAFTIAFVLVIAFAIAGEKSINYILGATISLICWVLIVSLSTWFLRGPKGAFYKLAKWRYRRKMRWTARHMAARKTEINLSRTHRLLLTVDSWIHLVELHEVDRGSTLTERTETATSWTAFQHIEMTDQHAFLLVQRNWATILPRRAFPDDKAFRQFVDLARHLHQTAIHGKAPPLQSGRVDERITS